MIFLEIVDWLLDVGRYLDDCGYILVLEIMLVLILLLLYGYDELL